MAQSIFNEVFGDSVFAKAPPKTIRLTLTSAHLVQIASGKTITFKAAGTILELRK